jgi:hypothetical protein
MEYVVIGLDNSYLNGSEAVKSLSILLDTYNDPLIVTVPALPGVAERLVAALPTGTGRAGRNESLIAELREEHYALAMVLGAPAAARDAACLRIDRLLRRLWTLLVCPAVGSDRRAQIVFTGERLAAVCVALALIALGRPLPIVEPAELGLAPGLSADDVRIRALIEAFPGVIVPGSFAASILAETLGAYLVDCAAIGCESTEWALFAGARASRACRLVARRPGVA